MEIINVTATPEQLRETARTAEFSGLVEATVALLAERNLPEELSMIHVPRSATLPIRRYDLAALPGASPHMTAVRQGDRRPVYTVEVELPLPSTMQHVGMVAAKYAFPLIRGSARMPVAPPHIINLGYRTAVAQDCRLASEPEACWHHHSFESAKGMDPPGAVRAMVETLRAMGEGELFTNTFTLGWVSIPSLR